MNRRIESTEMDAFPMRRKLAGVGLAAAAIAVAAWAMTSRPEAMAPAALVKAAPPAFVLLQSSWAAAPRSAAPTAAPDSGFIPSVQQDDEAKRAAEARERWQNLDIAVTTER